MAKTKKEDTIAEKVERALEKTEKNIALATNKAEEKFEEAEKIIKKNLKKGIKKAQKFIEEEILEAGEKIGMGNEIIIEKNKEIKKELNAEEKKAKLAKLLEKAKKLEAKVEEIKPVDLRKRVRAEGEEEKKETLVPMDDYLKSSIHLGTRVITPDMRQYVYRRRADGLAVFNTALLDDKLREGAAYLAKFAPEDIILVCKREAGWKAANLFAKIAGVRIFTKKYPAGILTNTKLENFTEAKLIFICDPWLDKNALIDANRVGISVLSLCDTNNFTAGINQIIIGNNKSTKSLGMIFYLLAKLYVEQRSIGIEVPSIENFVDGWAVGEGPFPAESAVQTV